MDEVLNAVKNIMYNCLDTLESFPTQRRAAQLENLVRDNGIGEGNADVDTKGLMGVEITAAEELDVVFSLAGISHGVSELKALSATQANGNLDKLELYTLRNIVGYCKFGATTC